jgi:metallo-beta-lactamase family protein
MKLKFLGATGTVTGSKYLLEHNRKKIMIDCGLFQGLKELRLRNWAKLPINVNDVDCLILTHAHLDHTGYIPRLVKEGFKGKIYCTHATKDLCKILLADSGHIQEEDAKYANKKGFSKHHPALPLYNFEEAIDSLHYFRTVDYDKEFDLGEGISLKFGNAGHILGSSNVTISVEGKTICFSGDLGRENDPILRPPSLPEDVDYLVVESTYGNRKHPETNPLDDIEKIINRTIKRNGVVIIPAFAVGRTQSLLKYISDLRKENRIPDVPIYLNSPMASNVTGLYCDYHGEHKLSPRECHELCNIATYVNNAEESKRLNLKKGPMIIISASGMATGGRVIHHIKQFAGDAKNTLLFTGFQAKGTRGEKIVSGAVSVKIHGQYVPIHCEIENLHNLSAHADQDEIVNWLKKFGKTPTKIFITHGEASASEALKMRLIEELKWNCEIPEYF